MIAVITNKDKTQLSAEGERNVVLIEAICCIESLGKMLAEQLNTSKDEVAKLVVKAITE